MINKGKMQEGRPSTVIAMKVYYQQSSRAKHLVNRRWYLHKLLLGTELSLSSLSSRGRVTLGVGKIFWFISHTLPQCHALQGVRDTYLYAASQLRIC
jgi:hypothetical protein